MSTPSEAFELLCEELERSLPHEAMVRVLGHPLAELARVLEQPAVELDGGTVAGPTLDLLEGLLEAMMHEAGWPAPGSGGAR